MSESKEGNDKNEIDVNVYGNDCKSLSFTTEMGEDATVGVINSGAVLDVDTEREEHISVIEGSIAVEIPSEGNPHIHGGIFEGGECALWTDHKQAFHAGKGFTLPANTKGVKLSTEKGGQAVYKCVYVDLASENEEDDYSVDTGKVGEELKDAARVE